MKFGKLLSVMVTVVAMLCNVACDSKQSNEVKPTPEAFEWYYTFDGGDRVEIKSVIMEQHDRSVAVQFSAAEEFDRANPSNHLAFLLPIEAIGQTYDIVSNDVTLYSDLECFGSPVGNNSERDAEPIKGGNVTLTVNDDGAYDISLVIELSDGRQFEAYCVGECEIVEVGPKYDHYIEINGEQSELHSMLYLVNDTGDYGNQYVVALSETEQLDTLEDIQLAEEYLFLSLGQESFDLLLSNGEVNPVSLTDPLYMFYVTTKELFFEDYMDDHSMIISGRIAASVDEETNDLALELEYETIDGDELKVVALVRYVAIESPIVEYESHFDYTIDATESKNGVGAAFYSTTSSAAIYTLCVGNSHTFASIEDSVLVQLSLNGMEPFEEFELDIATCTQNFKLWFYNPLTEYRLTIDNKHRADCQGSLSLKDGVLKIDFTNTPADASSSLSLSAQCATSNMRSVCECMDIYDGEHAELFTPRSIVVDNRGAECWIYVSSKSDVFTVEGMTDAEVVIYCPEGGWEKLLSGQFMSGSAFPDMSITLNGETFIKSNCQGLNCRMPEFDAEANTLTLLANTYTNMGGMSLYYSGGFTLLE